jgi:hypothetical protein
VPIPVPASVVLDQRPEHLRIGAEVDPAVQVVAPASLSGRVDELLHEAPLFGGLSTVVPQPRSRIFPLLWPSGSPRLLARRFVNFVAQRYSSRVLPGEPSPGTAGVAPGRCCR